MRIATWNVERVKPHGWKIAPAQRRRMNEVDADMWILTETHIDHSPRHGYYVVHTPAIPDRRPADERWVGIWSRYAIAPITDPAPRGRGTVAAIADAPIGQLDIYGCVISWANEPVLADGSPATMWQAHAETITQIDHDLGVIRDRRPSLPIVIGGDFKQDRDGSGWYGTNAVRQQLTDVLDGHGLVCVTGPDVVAEGMLGNHHLVDHICVPGSLAESAAVSCWETVDDAGVRLSDHPTVAIDLTDADSLPSAAGALYR